MYVKLFGSILDSSVWGEPLPSKVVWITLLCMADKDGFVRASLGGLARRAGVTRDDAAQAIEAFSQPDPDSMSSDHEGRRVRVVEGGFEVLNYSKYRELQTERQRRDAERQRRKRAKNRTPEPADGCGRARTRHACHDASTPEAEADTKASSSSTSRNRTSVEEGNGGATVTPPEPRSSEREPDPDGKARREAVEAAIREAKLIPLAAALKPGGLEHLPSPQRLTSYKIRDPRFWSSAGKAPTVWRYLDERHASRSLPELMREVRNRIGAKEPGSLNEPMGWLATVLAKTAHDLEQARIADEHERDRARELTAGEGDGRGGREFMHLAGGIGNAIPADGPYRGGPR